MGLAGLMLGSFYVNGRDVRLTLRRIGGEWCVAYVEDGEMNAGKSYFTDERKDAEAMLRSMQRDLERAGGQDRWNWS